MPRTDLVEIDGPPAHRAEEIGRRALQDHASHLPALRVIRERLRLTADATAASPIGHDQFRGPPREPDLSGAILASAWGAIVRSRGWSVLTCYCGRLDIKPKCPSHL